MCQLALGVVPVWTRLVGMLIPPLLAENGNYPIAKGDPATAVVFGVTYSADDGTVPVAEGTKGIHSRFYTVHPTHVGDREWEGAAGVPPVDPVSSAAVTGVGSRGT